MKTSIPRPCADWAEQLAAVFPADLPPADRAALEAHLATCPACAAVKADYQRMDARIRALPAPRPLRGLPSALLQLWAEEDQRRLVSSRMIPFWSTEDGMRIREEENVSKPAPKPQPQNRHTRRLVSGISAIAAVVVIAIIVIALVFSRSAKPTNVGTAPGNVPSSQGWEAVPHLTNTSGLPVLAPSNPQVVYEAQLASINTPTSVTLQRSDNDGASWQTLPVPTGIAQVYTANFFVSPLNAQVVFVDFQPPCQTAQANNTAPALAPSGGGGNTCAFDYFSTDGGAHWSFVHWPVHQAGTSHPGFSLSMPSSLQAQGNRLYALVNANIQNGNDEERSFVSSTDGGATWHFADQELAAQGFCVADYVPTPTGTTVFAAVTHCSSTGAAARSSLAVPAGGVITQIWRSEDAGVHWTLAGPVDGFTTLSLSLDSAGHPVLFISPAVLVSGGGAPATTIPAQVSVDGGKTWQNAPTINGQLSASEILGTLNDGSIIVAYAYSTAPQDHLFSWKPGDAAWRQLSPGFSDTPQYLLIVPNGSGGHDTLWLVTAGASGTFSVLKFTLP